MEVEVKLRLPDAAAHQLLSASLSPFHLRTHLHDNFFFDSAAAELSSRRAVLRLRLYDSGARAVLSLKARAVLVDGISRVEEEEEDLEPALARSILASPAKLSALSKNSKIMRRVVDEVGDVGSFVCLGGFKNVRSVYQWEGLVVELDETQYEFGRSYEVECETPEPELAREKLKGLLESIGVPYTYSQASKFAVFRSGKLLP